MVLGNQRVVAQDRFLGEIQMFSGNYAPNGWAFCSGQIMSIAQNQALFALLGTTYGGNGVTTFALPDLRGRVPLHYGNGIVIGQQSGTENNTLISSQLPAHTHTMNATTSDANQSIPTGNLPADTKALDPEYSNAAANTTMNPTMLSNVGGNQPINNIQPSATVTYIIAITGIFPSQN